ncbi:hypothetical protein [Streptomyces californicus]|uniref:hypothetical protein n=1 Tax=Streptomyces californicus TaxID=67351 RepID=UPI003F55B55C
MAAGSSSAADTAAPTRTAQAHQWSWSLRSNNQTNATVRRADEPAATLFFDHRGQRLPLDPRHSRRPAGQRAAGAADPNQDHHPGSGRTAELPADYLWQQGQTFSQIDNAVPPRLAAHLLAPHLNKLFNLDNFTLAA